MLLCALITDKHIHIVFMFGVDQKLFIFWIQHGRSYHSVARLISWVWSLQPLRFSHHLPTNERACSSDTTLKIIYWHLSVSVFIYNNIRFFKLIIKTALPINIYRQCLVARFRPYFRSISHNSATISSDCINWSYSIRLPSAYSLMSHDWSTLSLQKSWCFNNGYICAQGLVVIR